ncbi:MAG: sulfotransferase [Thermoplasmata archaeon]|nr:sulfotransferase [Thermoplasmata archaeon]
MSMAGREVSPPAASGKRPIDVVYIVGTHRSGGTTLGTILSSGAGVFYAGELYRFPFPIFDPGDPGRMCSCGAPVAVCPFWAGVRADAEARPGLLPELRRGQKRFEAWRRAPLTLLRMTRKDPAIQRHAERMEEFLRIVADRAGASVVVESSYSALRGMLYRQTDLGGGRVRFIHLVRDGRSFFGSELGPAYGTHPGSPWQRVPPAIVARWTAFHTAAIAFCSRGKGTYLRLRFEDVLLRPKESLRAVQAFLGVDFSEAIRRVEEHQPIAMNHICSANRARLAGSLTVRPELAAPSPLSRAHSALFWSMAGWLALALGYRPGSRQKTAVPVPPA